MMAEERVYPRAPAEVGIKSEAEFVINEVRYAVEDIRLSSVLESNTDLAYINLTSKENNVFCLELSSKGFKVVGHAYDKTDSCGIESSYFETIYAFLDTVSQGYRDCFTDALRHKLERLEDTHRDKS